MPPRRPLPDLCWIAVFQMQTLNDQLMASKMSPRSATLVRAANRQVKSLVITSKTMKQTNYQINSFLLASVPSMKLLKEAGETFPDYPVTTSHFSKWNCLQLGSFETLDQSTSEQIVNNFSAVSELKCIFNGSNKNLVALLDFHPQWANQLINLMVVDLNYLSSELDHHFYTAINYLSALQCLALSSRDGLLIPNMPIFKQLKVIAVDFIFSYGHPNFLDVLERCASQNVDLQVHFLSIDSETALSISESTGRQIVRCECVYDYPGDQVPRLCQLFPALTSLSVKIVSPDIGPLFTALSQLSQLVHLTLRIYFVTNSLEEQPIPPPLMQLPSVRALDLRKLCITSHSQLKGLQWALPNLQVIQLDDFRCRSCKVDLDYLTGKYKKNSKQTSAALKCFRETLSKLHSGVPPGRIIVSSEEPYTFLDQLLQSAASETFSN